MKPNPGEQKVGGSPPPRGVETFDTTRLPKKQEPVRRASVETGAGMILGSALVLIMKHVFKTDLSIEDALIVVSAVGLVANYLSGEVARLKVTAAEK